MMIPKNYPYLLLIVLILAGMNGLHQPALSQTGDQITSDSLWSWYQTLRDSAYYISADDSIAALKMLASGAKLTRKALTTYQQQYYNELKNGQEPKITVAALVQMFEEAITELETSLKLNPRDTRTQNNLKLLYPRQAELYEREKNNPKALDIYKALIIIDKRKAKYYYHLGDINFTLKKWLEARNYFIQAIDVELDTVWADVDTSLLFRSFFYRGLSEIRLNLPFKAIHSLDYASRLAPTEEWKTSLKNRIDWLEWDDGNIRASEMLDSLKIIESAKQYAEAHDGYVKLLDILTTRRARDNISWRIASLDFWSLDHKPEGIERLYQVIATIPVDSNGIAMDSSYASYLGVYCRMCFDMGIEHTRNNEPKQAFIYFSQATRYEWPGKARAYMQLARLTALDLKRAIEYCHRALTFRENLTEREQKTLYQYLQRYNYQTGNFDEAERWYVRFLQM